MHKSTSMPSLRLHSLNAVQDLAIIVQVKHLSSEMQLWPWVKSKVIGPRKDYTDLNHENNNCLIILENVQAMPIKCALKIVVCIIFHILLFLGFCVLLLQDHEKKLQITKSRRTSDYNYWKECISHYIQEEDVEQLEQKRAKIQSDWWLCVCVSVSVCLSACVCHVC